MSDKRDTPVSVFELREVASGRIGYGDTKYHLHLLDLAADEIERLSQQQKPAHTHGALGITDCFICNPANPSPVKNTDR